MTDQADPWSRAMRALTALAIDPSGLKGLSLRARVSPVRQTFENTLHILPAPRHRIHPDLSDTQLYGGLDVSASLAEQKLVRQAGLADRPCTLVLPMAERTQGGLAARLGQMLDAGKGHCLILLDEGADGEEIAPTKLRERLAFEIDLDGLHHGTTPNVPSEATLRAARDRLPAIRSSAEHATALAVIAAQFGIHSMRAPLLALRAACAFAALAGRDSPSDMDVTEAAELVYASRATRLPEVSSDPEPEQPPPESSQDQTDRDDTSLPEGMLEDMVIAAVTAQLPSDVLDRAAASAPRQGSYKGSGAGARRKGNRRGRPLPSRPGRLDGTSRIDIIATLRSAAPFQTLRKRPGTAGPRIILYPSDIRLRRFEDKSDRLLIFTVDASGSAAMARMAEAKGAVELMLAQAYSKRDQVALVAFRGTDAEVLLPPTRSLVQAKRRLAGLPGGGGTPLALGMIAAAEMAEVGRMHGLSPSLVILTDGRANIDLNGEPGREQARADAEKTARHLRTLGLPAVVIDTAARPGKEGEALASWLGSHYLALPRADAERISAAADAALGG
jgi:magnesium chelatase subunit D